MSKAAELANLIGNINAGGGGTNKNVIINSAMNVAQRGTSSTGIGASDGYFVCDRWNFAQATNAGRLTMTQDSSAPSGFANSLKLACTTADTSIGADEAALIQQRIEGQNLQAFAKGTSDAKPFALSFYVKGNASATYTAELFDNDNSRGNGQLFNVTTDWTRVELTFPADTTGAFDDDVNASLYFNIWLHAGSTYTGGTFTNGTWTATSNANVRVGDGTSFFDSTSRTFFITGVQLEVGQNPTEFEHKPYVQHLLDCQRYTFVVDATDDNEGSGSRTLGIGTYYNGTSVIVMLDTPVEMRATPSLSVDLNGDSQWLQSYVGASGSNTNAGLNVGENGNNTAHRLYLTSSHSSRTAGQSAWNMVLDGARFVMSAEL